MGEAQDADDFAVAFEAAFARLQVTILKACQPQREWPAKIAAGVRSGLEFAAGDPAAARLLTNDALASGPEGIVRYERLVAYLSERFFPGREECPDGERLPETTERAMAGGVVTLVAQRLDRGESGELAALAPEAIQFVLTPYLGADRARRVAAEIRPPGPPKP